MEADFDGTPLVAGSLIGIRAFRVRGDGTLTGVAYEVPYEEGENEAKCMIGASTWLQQHKMAGLHCSCGFYAYFHKGHSAYLPLMDYGERMVTGLIEGYGRCTVGSLGFRAEKAKIIALVLPDPPLRGLPWVWRTLRRSPALILALIGCAISSLSTTVVILTDRGQPTVQVISSAIFTMVALTSVLFLMSFVGRPTPGDIAARAVKIRRRYPDIPTYRSSMQAIAAHPPSTRKQAINRKDDDR